MLKTARFLLLGVMIAISCNCRSTGVTGNSLVVSVSDQRMVLLNKGKALKSYSVSTSKFGLGSTPRSYKTPLGEMYICQKIGDGMRAGTVFKNRKPTGEVVGPDAPGRDPIVSRILWLEGREKSNANTRERLIYIHGTPEERNIGWPTSYGCIRMKSVDIIDLFARVRKGTRVSIKEESLTPGEIPRSERLSWFASKTRSYLTISRRDSEKTSHLASVARHSPPLGRQSVDHSVEKMGVLTRLIGTSDETGRRLSWKGFGNRGNAH